MKFSSSEITQMIVAIIGLIGLIFQGIITYLISQSKINKTKKINPTIIKISQRFNKKPKKYKWINLIIAFIFLTITIPGIYTFYIKKFNEPYIIVNFPQENQYVEPEIDINGKYRNIDQKEQLIWIAVYSNIDKKYFLHSCPADINSMHKAWTNDNTIIGVVSDKNEKFRILILLVSINSKCHEEISNYINDESRHGLDNLPKGCQILKDITVFIK